VGRPAFDRSDDTFDSADERYDRTLKVFKFSTVEYSEGPCMCRQCVYIGSWGSSRCIYFISGWLIYWNALKPSPPLTLFQKASLELMKDIGSSLSLKRALKTGGGFSCLFIWESVLYCRFMSKELSSSFNLLGMGKINNDRVGYKLLVREMTGQGKGISTRKAVLNIS